jgi:regulator of protease activity HflC (stomatin/prohibitin superfamily)
MMIIGFIIGVLGTGLIGKLIFHLATHLGLYAIIREGECKVFVLFGKVIRTLDEPGLHLLVTKIGPHALLIPYFGKVHTVDMRLDQEYLRSQPVNSEEGTPMGIGVWYEMRIGNPADYLFKNNDPRGSLRANVSSATVRCLSNMPLSQLLENRHPMSHHVRQEVTPRSESWGYRLGSIYIRKVHFRDHLMIRQIEQKVGNRLLQVTSAIRQAGANQVDVVKSAAEKRAATEFARASSMRPRIVGSTLNEISQKTDVTSALLEILEIKRLCESKGELTLIPEGTSGPLLNSLAVDHGK